MLESLSNVMGCNIVLLINTYSCTEYIPIKHVYFYKISNIVLNGFFGRVDSDIH